MIREAYADRAYQPNGLLVPRSEPGAVLHDPAAIAERAVRLARAGEIVAIDGTVIADRGAIALHPRRHAGCRRHRPSGSRGARSRAGLRSARRSEIPRAMTAKIIDGKTFAEGLRARIAGHVERLKREHGVTPGLAVVIVGDDPASQVYVSNKAKQTVEVGMHSEKYELPEDTPEAEVLALVERLNADPKIHGILVQLPLPKQIDPNKVIATISPDKDVDCFTPGERRQGADRPAGAGRPARRSAA